MKKVIMILLVTLVMSLTCHAAGTELITIETTGVPTVRITSYSNDLSTMHMVVTGMNVANDNKNVVSLYAIDDTGMIVTGARSEVITDDQSVVATFDSEIEAGYVIVPMFLGHSAEYIKAQMTEEDAAANWPTATQHLYMVEGDEGALYLTAVTVDNVKDGHMKRLEELMEETALTMRLSTLEANIVNGNPPKKEPRETPVEADLTPAPEIEREQIALEDIQTRVVPELNADIEAVTAPAPSIANFAETPVESQTKEVPDPTLIAISVAAAIVLALALFFIYRKVFTKK